MTWREFPDHHCAAHENKWNHLSRRIADHRRFHPFAFPVTGIPDSAISLNFDYQRILTANPIGESSWRFGSVQDGYVDAKGVAMEAD
jgi:hypothetical protein